MGGAIQGRVYLCGGSSGTFEDSKAPRRIYIEIVEIERKKERIELVQKAVYRGRCHYQQYKWFGLAIWLTKFQGGVEGTGS
jgi:hypothetical protein